MTTCPTCGLTVDKLSSGRKCQLCYNEYMADYMNKRYHARRKEAIELLGGVCVICGSNENLEFDHVDESSKALDVGKAFSRGRQRYLDEISKCQLLCKTCHQNKSTVFQSVDHGGGITGKKNCYCDLCAELKRRYQREFKRRVRMLK